MVGWDPKGEYDVHRGASLTTTSTGPSSTASGSSGTSAEFYQFKCKSSADRLEGYSLEKHYQQTVPPPPILNAINFVMFIDNFQPESVDKSRPGGLVGNGETFELEFSGNGGSSSNIDQGHNHSVLNGGNSAGGETYSWSSTERQGRLVDCLLIFDEETQVI